MTADIDALRTELADRLDAHPFEFWSPRLLALVVNAIDIEFGKGIPGGGIDSGSRRRLTVVR